MPEVYYPSGRVKQVKNLGWLLRNWKMVVAFEVVPTENGAGLMIAKMKDGRIYYADWVSFSHCREWLHRPVFFGLPLMYGDEATSC